MAATTPEASAPPPIRNAMEAVGYQAGRFWATRIASLAAFVGFLWFFHTILVPKLSIYDIRLLVLSLLFATLAVSLNLINGVTGQFSIGHAAFYLIGAIAAGKLTVAFYNPHPQHYQPQVWIFLMVLAGGVAAAIAGLLVGLPSLRLRGDYLAVATLGFGEIVLVFFRNQDGGRQAVSLTTVVSLVVALSFLYLYMWLVGKAPKVKGGIGSLLGFIKFILGLAVMRVAFVLTIMAVGPIFDRFGRLDTGGATGLQSIPKLTEVYFIVLLFVGTIAVSRNLLKSAHGLSFLAVREDELAADATGVSTTKIKVTAFAIGAAIAGMTGALFAHYNGSVSPDDFKMDVSFMLVAMVVIGGTGSITGAAIAGIGLKLLEEGLRKLPAVGAVDLMAMILVAILVYVVYRMVSKKGALQMDRGQALHAPLALLGLLGSLGLAYLGYLTFKSDLSWVLRVAIMLLFAGALVGIVFSPARRAALPRFGLFTLSLVILKFAYPVIAGLLHGIGPVENLVGKVTYAPHDLRWAVFSIALVFVMLLRSQGLLGHHEFSWPFAKSLFSRREALPA